MLQNTTHINNWRKKPEGEGAPKHDPLIYLEKENRGRGRSQTLLTGTVEGKKKGWMLPNTTNQNNWRWKHSM